MLWVVALILGLLWSLAVISSYTFGGHVHLLLVAAALVVVFKLVKAHLDRRFKKGV